MYTANFHPATSMDSSCTYRVMSAMAKHTGQ